MKLELLTRTVSSAFVLSVGVYVCTKMPNWLNPKNSTTVNISKAHANNTKTTKNNTKNKLYRAPDREVKGNTRTYTKQELRQRLRQLRGLINKVDELKNEMIRKKALENRERDMLLNTKRRMM